LPVIVPYHWQFLLCKYSLAYVATYTDMSWL